MLSAKYFEFLQVEGHRRFGNTCNSANNGSDTNYLLFLLFFSLPFESRHPHLCQVHAQTQGFSDFHRVFFMFFFISPFHNVLLTSLCVA